MNSNNSLDAVCGALEAFLSSKPTQHAFEMSQMLTRVYELRGIDFPALAKRNAEKVELNGYSDVVQLANVLINFPAVHRDWIRTHVAPATFSRWVGQIKNRAWTTPEKTECMTVATLKRRIISLMAGTEDFSDLAKCEGSHLGD